MIRTNTVPPPGARNSPQATTSKDTAPKGRYKSVVLTQRHGTTTSNSKLSPGYLRSFGFANTRLSSLPDASKPIDASNQQTAVMSDQDLWSSESSLPPLPTSPPPPLPQEDNTKEEKYSVLSESQLNVLSHNLSEIADKISPSKYDLMEEIDEESLESLLDENVGSPSETTVISINEQPVRFKTPYSRQCKDLKTYVSKQKSFTRKRPHVHRDACQEPNNNGEISFDTSNVLSFPSGNIEGFKQDNESDSGYSSSMSASISLSEEIEASKRLSFENGSSTDIEGDDLTYSRDDHVGKSSVESPGRSESTVGASFHQNTSNIEDRLDSLIHGVSSGIGDLSLNSELASEMDVNSQRVSMSNGSDETSTSFKLFHESSPALQGSSQGVSDGFSKSPFRLPKVPLDVSELPKGKTGKRPGLVRRRTTLMSFRPPKQMTVQEGESDIVEMDEAGFLQMLTDLKSFKTQLLKLKRELQEADVVSPLMHSHSCVPRKGSTETDVIERNSVHRKRMLLRRTMTMDTTTMQQRLLRTTSLPPSASEGVDNLDDTTELSQSSVPRNQTPVESNAGENEEVKNLREELGEMKEKLIEITTERNSLLIAREELEHELDSKNHTIRMLQKQLESQTDSQDEMAYLKRQVKSLTNQIQQQQQKITELRYRTSSPGPVTMGAISKETVKADIRNRLRNAFVKHLGESSKSNVQLSKYIQKAEQSISMAQKGLSSLYSSPHASTEHLPKDKSGPSFQRSDSQSSVERGQEDSDGRESESDSSKCSRRDIASARFDRNNEDLDSESGKSMRRRSASPSTFRSLGERRVSDPDYEQSSRRPIVPSSFDRNSEEINKTDLDHNSAKSGVQIEVTDTDKGSKTSPMPLRSRKLSRSKLMTKIEASPLSHSWTPGAIEKIVKSWREAKSPTASQEKAKEEEKPTLKHVSHVQFL